MPTTKKHEDLTLRERTLLEAMLRRSLRARQFRLAQAQQSLDEAQARLDEFEAEEERIARAT